MKVAFYRYKYGNIKDWLIAKLTHSEFSHCEIVFDDGTCFSSSPRDGGVRRKKIDLKKDRWVLVDFKVTKSKHNHLEKKSYQLHSFRYEYDWLAIFFHWLRIRSYSKFICSDVCYYLLTNKLDFKTPQQVYEYVKSQNRSDGSSLVS